MTIYYRNSRSASLLSIFGCLVCVGGIIAFVDTQELVYFLNVAAGLVLLWGGHTIGCKADFTVWLQSQKQSELEKKVKKNLSYAMEKYQECPNKFTYEYIRNLNPEAGEYIKKDREESRKNRILSGKKN